ncbi:4Fe-4S binding protein [Rhizobium sp. R693]|uniref:4Fe-4S binding protein n=1 Tax=Rhizobium sp. R693 TaxID=1764276 RepID=UPI000B529847|nr:4Fe-4S binding protein [Rhizobium sp. R693]OWV84644.1 hypothetical protein ATY79_12090 [Rhizobium sp. R693]
MSPMRARADALVAGVGDLLVRHKAFIRRLQWTTIVLYAVLLVLPLFLPLPTNRDFMWNNLTRFAQFVFWGLWWPFVILGTALIGRFWCGLLCPEGALSEFASERGAGRAIPSWMKWSGWPVVSFISTTVYGQLTSIYQYPKPAALLLGGSTLVAMVVGARYGKAKRVWCRFLCPVSGVFGLVSKIAPLHFKVETEVWKRPATQVGTIAAVNCAPLIPIKTMQGGSACHMCGRCSGHRGAIRLAWRRPASDIVYGSGRAATRFETFLIVPVLLGLVPAALHWSSSSLFVSIRQWLAELCVSAHWIWPLSVRLPWWALTNYPSASDVMTVIDGLSLLVLIAMSGVLASIMFVVALVVCSFVLGRGRHVIHHLAQALIPVAAASLFCGLLSLTITQLRSDGIDLLFIDRGRGIIVLLAGAWSVAIAGRIAALYTASVQRRALATTLISIPTIAFSWGWLVVFLS